MSNNNWKVSNVKLIFMITQNNENNKMNKNNKRKLKGGGALEVNHLGVPQMQAWKDKTIAKNKHNFKKVSWIKKLIIIRRKQDERKIISEGGRGEEREKNREEEDTKRYTFILLNKFLRRHSYVDVSC